MAASFYKRKMQVKDYSNWLPGQGGFLDRFDSLLCAGCFYFIFYMLIFSQ
jgi:phosphatidate cytidylyltransferase